MGNSIKRPVARFEDFEVNLETGEVWKAERRLKVQDQPFKVLAALLVRSGQIVTREELRQLIWPEKSFGDFDHAINLAIAKLRAALGDSADAPHLIETLPRRGYRFIAPLASFSPTDAPLESVTSESIVEVPRLFRTKRLSFGIFSTALAMIAVVIVMGIAWLKQPEKHTLQIGTMATPSGWRPALSRDGKLLAYTSIDGDGPPHIWVQQTAGGEAVPATPVSYSGNEADFSPDGTRIVFYSEKDGGGIYVTSTLPGEPRLVLRSPMARRPRFSPRGDRILFWQDYKAFTVSLAAGERVALPLNQEFHLDSAPIWSPNGTEILFYGARNQDLNARAWWIASVGQGQARRCPRPRVEENYVPAGAVIAWIRSAEGREWIVYSTANLENWTLWRVGISAEGAMNQTPEFLLSGTGKLGAGGSASEDGKVAYNLSSSSASIYQISINDRGQKLGPTIEVPLRGGVTHTTPSVSRDGKWMAYSTFAPRKPNIVLLRNLSTGAEQLLDDKDNEPGVDQTASISPDGASVAFERDCKEGISPENPHGPLPCGFIVSATGGEPQRICVLCNARGYSSDGSVVLLEKYDRIDPNRDQIVALDLSTKKEKQFLSDPHRPLYDSFFSWDDRWVAFVKMPSLNAPNAPSQLMIAPVRQGLAATESEWIAVTDGQHHDGKPQFSADGNTMYFTSTRDGYLCIWAQRLDPVTKRPTGPPRGYEHFHNSAGHYGASEQAWLYLSVARDKIMFNLPQIRSEVWITKME